MLDAGLILADFFVREHWDGLEKMDRMFGPRRPWRRVDGVCWVGVKSGQAFTASIDPRDGVVTFFPSYERGWSAGLSRREQKCAERENSGHGAHRQAAIIDRAEGTVADEDWDD